MIVQLNLRVQILVFVLVVLGTAAFVFAAYFIFNDVAVTDIQGISITSVLRSQAVECVYLERSMLLAALANDTDAFDTARFRIANVSKDIGDTNWKLYHE